MTDPRNPREWLYRAISFETDAEHFRSAGIRIGADASPSSAVAWDALLAPFSVKARSGAIRMARLYALLFCFENSIRDLVAERLSEVGGENWWEERVSPTIKKYAQGIYDKAIASAWLDGAKGRMIDFTTFGQLVKIIIDNWSEFDYLIPSQSWLNQKLNEVEEVRNFIAHSRMLSDREFERMVMYIDDWNRQIGL